VYFMAEYILEAKDIIKEFPGVKALDGVTFGVTKGEIHALVGENGAGKSTLMKIVSGVYPLGSFKGELRVDGKDCRFKNIKESEAAGIAIIHQEMALIKELNVTENILLGNEVQRAGIIQWDKAYRKAEEAIKRVGLNINPAQEVRYLGVGEQQLVEIAKALSKDAHILILDEPTAALSENEAGRLLAILEDLKTKGVTCIYISHRLKEILHIADRVTVMRDGKTIATLDSNGLTEELLIAKMVGRELTQVHPPREHKRGDVIFEVKNWNVSDDATNRGLFDLGFQLHRGEVFGIAGLVGAGRSEFMMSLFGVWGKKKGGTAILNGKNLAVKTPEDAIKAGISIATEDRKRYGLVLIEDIKNNVSLASLDKISSWGIVDENKEVGFAEKYTKDLQIKTPSVEQKTMNLSGGNQQKVVLAKWLMTMPSVLILDEPTRGIDVGAKYEIYTIINQLAEKGVGIIIVSSEMPELLGMCDRIMVMHEGKITGTISAKGASQEKIMQLATGGTL